MYLRDKSATEEEKHQLGRFAHQLKEVYFVKEERKMPFIGLLLKPTEARAIAPYTDNDFAKYIRWVHIAELRFTSVKGDSMVFSRRQKLWIALTAPETQAYITDKVNRSVVFVEQGGVEHIPCDYAFVHNLKSIHTHLGNHVHMNHILKTLASSEVDFKFEKQLDASPFLVSQNDDTVLNLETLEVREREMEDYCSKQSVSRYAGL